MAAPRKKTNSSSKRTQKQQLRRQRKPSEDAYEKPGRKRTYSRNIHRLLKCVCPDRRISVKAMNVMNSLVEDLFRRIATEASVLVHHANKKTMQYNDIIVATKLLITTHKQRQFAIEMAIKAVDWTEF